MKHSQRSLTEDFDTPIHPDEVRGRLANLEWDYNSLKNQLNGAMTTIALMGQLVLRLENELKDKK